jgi:cysteinyl-tRNA synthetase
MSKSLGNFVTVKDALKKYRPEVVRMFALSAHYSSPVTYSDESMVSAQGGWERINNAVRLTRQMMNSAPQGDAGNGFIERLNKARADFVERMDDDFNAPMAIAVLQELTRDVNTLLNSGAEVGMNTLTAIDEMFSALGGEVLGIVSDVDAADSSNAEREAGLVQMLIDMRAQARKNRNFAEADRIRDELAKLGVILEDRADGTIWKVS